MQKNDFLKAIEVGEPPSAAEGLDLDKIGNFVTKAAHNENIANGQ